MARVLVYCTNPDIKKKIFGLATLLEGYDFCFLSDLNDFKEDLPLLKPECLIIEGTILETVTGDPISFVLIQSVRKLIIIGDTIRSVALPSGLTPVLLSFDFDSKELANAIVPSDHSHLKLPNSNNTFNRILDNIPIAIFWKDKNLKYLGCNKVFADDRKLTDTKDMIGLSDFDIYPEAEAMNHILSDQGVISAGATNTDNLELGTNHSARPDMVWESKIPLRDDKGEIIGLMGMYENISGERMTESELRNEKRLLQMLMDNIPDTIYFKDTNSRFTRINNAKARTLGIQDSEEAVGKTDADYFDAVHSKKALKDEQELMKSGIPILNKLEHIKEDGRNRFVTSTKVPLKDEKGRIIGLVGISRDVTKNHEYEEKLLKEQNLLKALMDNIPDSIYFKDRKSRFIRINSAWARKYSPVNPEDAIGKTDIDFFHSSFAEETFHEEQLLMETAMPLINKLEKKVNADGSERYKLVTKVPVSGISGTIIGLVGISHDITDLKIAEIKLAGEKELLQSLMDNIPDSIYFKDRESKFTRINLAQAILLGIKSPDEVIGKSDFDFFPREEAEIFFQDEQEILKSGVPLINHIEKVTPADGNTVWMSSTIIPIKDKQGNISGLVGISRDVSVMEIARENLEFAKEKAEESNHAKSQFLANMSHEIRTPMNGVIGMADIMSYTSLTSEQQSYLDIILKSGNNLLCIINDILDLSKIESESLNLEKASMSIRGIMEDVADILIVTANNKNLEFVNYVDPLIPEIVEGDSIRLHQILINLVNNAIKFTPTGEVYFSAELQESTDNGYQILFEVRDSGIGIPKKAQTSLFQAFTQVDSSTTRKYGGTGLGLAISKRLAEMMGGTIGIESEEGKGSLFWFTAKFGIGFDIEPVAQPQKLMIDGLNVLIVDDNKTNRFIFGKYLETWNCKHQEASNGKAALQMMIDAVNQKRPFNIALLDYQMTEMDGFELAETIKANPIIATTRLILLSSVSDIILPNQVRQKGFHSFLNKPVKLKDLYSVISTVTGNKEVKISKHKSKEIEVSASLRILIAEDNPINLKVAQLIVNPFAGFLETAADGLIAYNKFREDKYDMILMDLQMPVLNGYEATKLIREYERMNKSIPVKIIAMTANAMKEDEDLCLSIGMDAYLSKPFRMVDMIRILKKIQLLDKS